MFADNYPSVSYFVLKKIRLCHICMRASPINDLSVALLFSPAKVAPSGLGVGQSLVQDRPTLEATKMGGVEVI